MIYMISRQTEKKAKVRMGDAIRVKIRNGGWEIIRFDKVVEKDKANFNQTRYLNDLHLQNFVNALACGHLDMKQKGMFNKVYWKQVFVVLTNVGLLYFDDPKSAPKDLFPVLNCNIEYVPPTKVKGITTAFRLKMYNKKITFNCCSLSEFDAWFRAIRML